LSYRDAGTGQEEEGKMSDTKRDIVERINGDTDDYDEQYGDGMTHEEGFDFAERLASSLSLASKEIVFLRERMRLHETEKWIDLHATVRAERDAALAENKRLAELNDTRLILLTAQTRTALSKAKVLEQDLSTARESLYTVAEQRNSALAERDAALAENERLIECDRNSPDKDKFSAVLKGWKEANGITSQALDERDEAIAERDLARAHRTTLWQAVEAARSVFSEDGVRDVVTAFTQYHVFTDRVADMDVRGEE